MPEIKEERILEIIKTEFQIHPLATLIDIYKLFYQSAFGPGHIITNENIARQYFDLEINSTQEWDPTYNWQDISFYNNYYRVNLKVIADQIIGRDELFEAFLNSQYLEVNLTDKQWQEEWKWIQNILLLNYPDLRKNTREIDYLDYILAGFNHYTHHSEIFKKHYSPHYRIVDYNSFNNLLLKHNLGGTKNVQEDKTGST